MVCLDKLPRENFYIRGFQIVSRNIIKSHRGENCPHIGPVWAASIGWIYCTLHTHKSINHTEQTRGQVELSANLRQTWVGSQHAIDHKLVGICFLLRAWIRCWWKHGRSLLPGYCATTFIVNKPRRVLIHCCSWIWSYTSWVKRRLVYECVCCCETAVYISSWKKSPHFDTPGSEFHGGYGDVRFACTRTDCRDAEYWSNANNADVEEVPPIIWLEIESNDIIVQTRFTAYLSDMYHTW